MEYLPCEYCKGKGLVLNLIVLDGQATDIEDARCQHCDGNGYFKQPSIQQEIRRNEVLNEIQNKLINQTQKGLDKYGHTVQVDSLSTVEWIDHAIEETIDKLVYLTCIKKSLEREKNEGD